MASAAWCCLLVWHQDAEVLATPRPSARAGARGGRGRLNDRSCRGRSHRERWPPLFLLLAAGGGVLLELERWEAVPQTFV